MNTHLKSQISFLKYSDLVEAKIVSNRTTLRRWILHYGFPKPVRLGPNSLGWRVADVERWLAERDKQSA